MSDHHCWSNVSSVTNITNKENVIVFYDILSCPCPIIMKQLSNPRPTVAPPPHMVSSKRAGPQCRQFSHDNWINYPRSDNPAPAWSQAPPHMNEHRQQTQRHLWECVWSQTSVNPIRHGQAPTISSAEDSWWARNTTWSGACVSAEQFQEIPQSLSFITSLAL